MAAWRRRWWRRDAAALAAFEGLRPCVVITGASEGIGLAFAELLTAAGSDILLIARDANRLDAVSAALRRSGGKGRVTVMALDVTAADAVPRIDEALAANQNYADILVNNAGSGLSGPFATQPVAAIENLLSLNIVALTRLTRHVLAGQLVRGRGGIINLASVGGYVPGPQQAVYYASKAYVISFSEAIAAETAGRGVHVMAVAPGPIDTGFHSKMQAEGTLMRLLVPQLSARRVAKSALLGFWLGHRVVVPGLINWLLVVCIRVLPHRLLLPLIGNLLRPSALPVEDGTLKPRPPPRGWRRLPQALMYLRSRRFLPFLCAIFINCG